LNCHGNIQVANWQAFHLRGATLPSRKGAAAAASGSRVLLFGGYVLGSDDVLTTTDELAVLEIGASAKPSESALVCCIEEKIAALDSTAVASCGNTHPPPLHFTAPGASGSASCSVMRPPAASAAEWPPARAGAALVEATHGQLMLLGGVAADGRPVNDAWLLDVAALMWRCVYAAGPDLLACTGEATACCRPGCLSISLPLRAVGHCSLQLPTLPSSK
jgi:hypothetical protein